MPSSTYQSMNSRFDVNRRQFLLSTSVVGAGLVLGTPLTWAQDAEKEPERTKPKTNIDEALSAPRTAHSLPGRYPGKSVEVHDPAVNKDGKPVAGRISQMVLGGLAALAGGSETEAYRQLMSNDDIVGIKVNPVGAGLISTRLEVVDGIIDWLTANGHPRERIVIWDRFDYMLPDAGFTAERFPGVQIEGLQTMDEAAAMGEREDDSGWLKPDGTHLSRENFDDNVFYWAEIDAPTDKAYLNQHVTNDQYSYFGKLVTQRLTKIINVPVFKNTGNGISMATKNLGYGAICNTGRLHRPLFFDVCTEVMAFPCVRDKLVLNVTDGIKGQYDGGPMAEAAFVFDHSRLYFATDPFALDMICHKQLLDIRKANGVEVNEHPMFTEYLRYAQRLGLGLVDAEKTTHEAVEMKS